MKRLSISLLAAALAASLALEAGAQSALEEIAKYREALAQGNPAELWEARGEALWKQKRGPKNASLEQCNLGKGPGVVQGAYAEMPRYFADVDRVMDLETRLAHCVVTLQGFKAEEVTARPYGAGTRRSDFESLAAFVTAESRGVKMNVPTGHPKEQETIRIGEKIFFFRGGPHDFACATCHSENDKRIRLQDLPNITQRKDAQRGYTTWPAYRVSQGELRTMQWRLYDCFRQQRFPELKFGSEASIALTAYLAHNAQDGVYAGPAIKR